MVSIKDKGGHIFMHLIESVKFNRGAKRLYIEMRGNLVAFVCRISFDRGYDGFVSFESKTRLVGHYKKPLGPMQLLGTLWRLIRSLL